MEIHAEVANNIQNTPHFITSRQNSGRGPGTGDGEVADGAIGEYLEGSPIGDMLLPMLAMTLIYVISKIFRNRKTSQDL